MPIRGNAITAVYQLREQATDAPINQTDGTHQLAWHKADGSRMTTPPFTPSPIDPNVMPGLYAFQLSATDADTDYGKLTGISSAANSVIEPVELSFDYLPAVPNGSLGGLPIAIDAAGGVLVSNLGDDSLRKDSIVDFALSKIKFNPDALIYPLWSGQVTNISAGGITASLDQQASDEDGSYVGHMIRDLDSVGDSKQERIIVAYDSGSKQVTVDRAWFESTAFGSAIVYGQEVSGIRSNVSANIMAINNSAQAAINLALATGLIFAGQVVDNAGSSQVSVTTDLTETNNNQYNGTTMVWQSGPLVGQRAVVQAYDGTTKVITFEVVNIPPAVGDAFIIV